MKTYCKNIDILNLDFLAACVSECLSGKYGRNSVAQFLCENSEYTRNEIRNIINNHQVREIDVIIMTIAKKMQSHIRNKDVSLPPIHFSERYDEISKKYRIIGVQSIEHQCYEYVAVNACKELFYKKFGVYQCASIPNRGQSYGKKAIAKWVKSDVNGTRFAIKADVKKCYPSIDKNQIKKFLQRDLHKNPILLYLLFTLIDMYDTGLSIGSHLAQWLCNYYLSYGYHYISEKLFTTRKLKHSNKIIKVRLISHVIFYMDDIIIFGSNKKYLMMAMHKTLEYFSNVLLLTIKPNWRLFKVQYIDKRGKIRGSFVDMMGFRFYRGKTSIRQSIFVRIKRKYIRLRKKSMRKKNISRLFAQSIMSYWGWVKNTNSYKFSREYNIFKLTNLAKSVVSYYAILDNIQKKSLRRQRQRKMSKQRRKICQRVIK